MTVLRNLLTGKDNATWDLGRITWAGSWAAVLGAAAWHEYHKVAVDLVQFATALGIVGAGHGAALALKAKTEPEECPSGNP